MDAKTPAEEGQPEGWAAKYAGYVQDGAFGICEDGKKVWAKGTVTKVYVAANRFWVQVGGKEVWFRVDFHVDLVKWALQEGKTMHIKSYKEESDGHLVVHNFSGIGSR